MTVEVIEAIGVWVVLPICAVIGIIVAFGIDVRIRK